MWMDDSNRSELLRSGLFDIEWYFNEYPDLQGAVTDPVAHYVERGAAEGRDPNPLFDTDWYLAELGHPIGSDPLTHYLHQGAAADRDPHPLFDSKWYRERYLSGEPADLLPLAHYLFLWRRFDLQPNAMFSPRFYVGRYPDLRAPEIEPHVHYMRHGSYEGRRPSADFDPDFYASQLSAADREAYRGRLLEHYLRCGHLQGLLPGPSSQPDVRPERIERLVQAIDPDKPTITMVLHGLGGGVHKHAIELAEHCRARVNVLFALLNADGSVELGWPRTESGICFNQKTEIGGLVEVLRQCGLARLHIHHAFGGVELERLLDRLAVPFDLTVHDYFLLAPQQHLVDANGRFVGEDLARAAPQLCAGSIGGEPVASLRRWRRSWRWLLDKADRVIAPSYDTARRFARYYPERPIIVAAHLDGDGPAAPILVERLPAEETLRVALIGFLAPHKGYATALGGARAAAAAGAPLAFTLIGGSVDDDALRQAGVAVTGHYEDPDLPRLLRQAKPHLLWYPSQCPETYCYALSAGLYARLPLAVTDIGALPERLAGRSWTWVRPWTWSAGEWLEFFLTVRDRHFTPGVPPPVQTSRQLPRNEFYAGEYLTWLR